VIFLIHYDRAAGALVEIRSYTDDQRERANADRLSLEVQLNREGLAREIVILEASDEAALRRTHRRYFEGLKQLTAETPRS
jgi:hypothetical protein